MKALALLAMAAPVERPDDGARAIAAAKAGDLAAFESLMRQHQRQVLVTALRLMAELERGRAAWWRQVWVYGVGLAAVAVLVMMVRPHAETARVAMVMPAAVVEIAADAGQGAGSRPGGLPHREVGRRKRLPHRQAETILVKLETDNPDVVIYWMAEKKGD